MIMEHDNNFDIYVSEVKDISIGESDSDTSTAEVEITDSDSDSSVDIQA
jgi:hypothetical protein